MFGASLLFPTTIISPYRATPYISLAMFSFLWNGILVALGLSSHGSEVAAQGLAQSLPRRVNYFDLPLEISDKVRPPDPARISRPCQSCLIAPY